MASATTLLLIRHGETEWNAAGRIQGQTNSDLTGLGRRQAEAVAELLHDPGPLGVWPSRPSVLYSSDLDRTRQTTAPIAERLGLTPRFDPELREMAFGELEGLTRTELDAREPGLLERLFGPGLDPELRPPGGESRADLLVRARRVLDRIARDHPGETVAVVSHGGVITMFMRWVVGIDLSRKPDFSALNCSIAAFGHESGRFRMRAWGLTAAVEAHEVDGDAP